MGNEIEAIKLQISQVIEDAQKLAETIARGPGGREVALTITQLQQAEDWFQRAKQIIIPS